VPLKQNNKPPRFYDISFGLWAINLSAAISIQTEAIHLDVVFISSGSHFKEAFVLGRIVVWPTGKVPLREVIQSIGVIIQIKNAAPGPRPQKNSRETIDAFAAAAS